MTFDGDLFAILNIFHFHEQFPNQSKFEEILCFSNNFFLFRKSFKLFFFSRNDLDF